MLVVQVLPVLRRAFNRLLHGGGIFRVNTFEEQLQRRLHRSLIRKALPLVEIELASPQILSQLFLVSDVGERADETSDDSVLVDWTANHSDYAYFTIGSDD